MKLCPLQKQYSKTNNPKGLDHYLSRQNIKADVDEQLDKKEMLEYKKCKNDPIYFIEKWCKVVVPRKGKLPVDLFDYQKNAINTFNDNNFSIILAARRSGKCSHINTKVKLRNKKSGLIEEITMGELYERTKRHYLKDEPS